MDRADGVAVVIQEADGCELGLPVRVELLAPLAAQPRPQRIRPVVDRVEMAADPDRCASVEARIAARVRALHQEHPVGVTDHDVRNELLVGRVLLGAVAVEPSSIGLQRLAEPFQVGVVYRLDAEEVAAARNRLAREDQHTLHQEAETSR